ncbi:hypothetical protein ACIHFD_49730 [Nonomuraea sp. NPDC051941]|uniref:hypothetical protein n=1 Tax=Nonomuraea sp. NPDC051941 TaxID=3364373 RepID=UPI0037C5D5B5
MDPAERLPVRLSNWPYDGDGAGGWVHPAGSPYLVWWTITRVYARYKAPRRVVMEYHPLLRQEVEVVKQRFALRAYLVDLDLEPFADLADVWELEPRLERVLLHQRPRESGWFLRVASEEKLAEMEQYRVE